MLIDQNILLTKETPETPRQIKIADFGLAKMGQSLTGLLLVDLILIFHSA